MSYLLWGLLSIILSLLIVPAVRRFARRSGIIDHPKEARKIHKEPIPLLGGLGIFLAFIATLFAYLYFSRPDFRLIPMKFYVAIVGGGALLMLGGLLDDKFNLPPKYSWIFPAAASLLAVYLGVGSTVKFLTNPFGPPVTLDFKFLGLPFAGIFIWVWLMGMIYTTKFLDGLDGLCSGVTVIAGLTLFTLSLLPHINQSITATLAIMLSGATAGFLVYGFNPASIFLGEAGSTFLGFMLGVISVILGGKIATALLVMGIPILDVAWVIMRRLWYGQSPFLADRQHLHFRLLDIGFSQRQSVLILYGISIVFGFTAVFLQSKGKVFALLVLFALMIVLAVSVVMAYKKRHPHIEN